MVPPFLDHMAASVPADLIWLYIAVDALAGLSAYGFASILAWNAWRYGFWGTPERWIGVTLLLIWRDFWRGHQDIIRALGYWYDIYDIEMAAKIVAALAALALVIFLLRWQPEVRRAARDPRMTDTIKRIVDSGGRGQGGA